MFWTIQAFPECTHHIFLSHSAEDKSELVHPLFRALEHRGIKIWLDRHHYTFGRTSREALRTGLLTCRHVIFLITDAMLTQARGWCVLELAYAELLQENLVANSLEMQHVFLPMYFVDPSDSRLPRSVWQSGRDRGPVCPLGQNRVEWSVLQIEKFLKKEQTHTLHMRRLVRTVHTLREQLKTRPGLYERITKFQPSRLPL